MKPLQGELPIMIDTYLIRRGSGGDGKYRGGDGIVRGYKFLCKATVSSITERRKFAPYGLFGGKPGKKGRNILIRNKESNLLPPKAILDIKKGDILRIETPGGGGWGEKKK
jgi:N-methylhydantoinase B